MGELLASHKCAQLSLFFSLSLSRFQFFFFYSARHEEEYIIPCISPRVRKKRRNYRGERIYPPLEGAIRNRMACISMNAFDQLPFILHQSSFASLLSILDSGDFNPSSYHSLVSSWPNSPLNGIDRSTVKFNGRNVNRIETFYRRIYRWLSLVSLSDRRVQTSTRVQITRG